jgi:hypothetical protein
MKLVNGGTIENVECVSIWEQHNKWNVSVSGSNITSGMCQYPGAVLTSGIGNKIALNLGAKLLMDMFVTLIST